MTTNDFRIPGEPRAFPLLPPDPPRIGDFWLDARVQATASGITYTGHDNDRTVVLVLMGEGAADDLAARERFAGMVNKLHIDDVVARGGTGQGEGKLAVRYQPDADAPVPPEMPRTAPWVALVNDGSPRVWAATQGILDEVDLHRMPPADHRSGPGFEHYWIDRTMPGMTRSFPLPWPARRERAGWVTILVSWMLMLLAATLAVLIAIWLFHDEPPQAPPPPVEQPSQGGSGSPQEGSPSPQSGSPSPHSGSPSPQTGTPSGEGSPSPRSKL